MLTWTESDVAGLIKLAWEIGIAAGRMPDGPRRWLLADTVAGYVGADAWVWHGGRCQSASTAVTICWSETEASHSAPMFVSPMGIDERYRPQLDQLIESASHDGQTQTLIYTWEACSEENSALRNQCHSLVCFYMRAQQSVQCLEFLRKRDAVAFGNRETNAIGAMVPIIFTAETSSADGGRKSVSLPYNELTFLPKRQRQVLERLLQGTSSKNIASELGISRHTVNDYTKAIYRRFAVSGRAELASLFISQP